ncbi:bifunctional UDP-N-acetylglucosamine diphosphorylase/glucosamine-1-phosphate N-acetyltransferase GlmU [Pelagibacterium xiamenense]|uniref:bifunctional UDP-N-acetylglucosamine diphosphorylase/glucosamine-1-phosphate N-acetyltransferase GlmU n=1 Tax=Pelagibacterium xiamenense TaxID=2901140 RepID=UPI001E5FFF90|nr:bifunctional UDP-N-acetylglucosamine diphosphorylase/glucosamine-1-phosphate N-acetyltransferase GlmU [Pelagibacterium xiamenense]MCD7061039.1 bifunctional UDP-N-acetylglucosamine diphosphorylase/glucosamine-1-phosphate N-acetyltransferase GlmU [Pelagibacterium xiamenense]
MPNLLSIILAAGEGTRMKSDRPKVLHEVGRLPIVGHVLKAATAAGSTDVAMITGPGHEAIRAAVSALNPNVRFFEQVERRGTAHAAMMAAPAYEAADGYVAVVYGDHPLLRAENFAQIVERLDDGLDVTILGFEPEDPTGYGRLITDGDRLLAIREHKDASAAERAIGLCNACVLGFKAEVFRALIGQVSDDNAQGEYYLTDLVELANAAGYSVGYAVAPEVDVMGVNDRVQLSRAEAIFQERRRIEMMRGGVTLIDPASTYFAYDTQIAQDVTVEPHVVFGPGVTIETGATVHAFSHIEGAHVGPNAIVGPFARLRPEAVLAEGAKVGNFVEIKKANIGTGAKVNHLTYIGDAEIGAGSNVGAGTVTCNYDGYNKARTVIGQNAFIGSNSALVAPVEIGEGAYIASGSVITEPVPADSLGIGRARQTNKPGYGKALRERFSAHKHKKQG